MYNTSGYFDMDKEEFYLTVNKYFDVLGNPLQFLIFLKILNDGGSCDIYSQEGITRNCVTGIMKELNIPQSTVSTYIKSLQESGLIECVKRGKFLYCKPKKEAVKAIKNFADISLKQIRY